MGKKENFVSQWEKMEKKANNALEKVYEQYLSLDS